MRWALRGGSVDHRNPIPPKVSAMYRRYRQMISDKELFDRLGVSREEGDALPAEFLSWAREFERIEREVTADG